MNYIPTNKPDLMHFTWLTTRVSSSQVNTVSWYKVKKCFNFQRKKIHSDEIKKIFYQKHFSSKIWVVVAVVVVVEVDAVVVSADVVVVVAAVVAFQSKVEARLNGCPVGPLTFMPRFPTPRRCRCRRRRRCRRRWFRTRSRMSGSKPVSALPRLRDARKPDWERK